jgi:hypothetical protein
MQVYDYFKRFWEINAKMARYDNAREAHAQLANAGYVYQYSFYGTLKRRLPDGAQVARREVVANRRLAPLDVITLYALMTIMQPERGYELYILITHNRLLRVNLEDELYW